MAYMAPARALPGQLAQHQQDATLEPESYDAIDNIKAKAWEHLHGGMQIFVKPKGLRI